ncbi:SACOL1771 family peroxiredoxin [Staphylococcus schleiferi subsp. coagulans]|uniref:SACOL1771 family peroxiredoxin n=1 Tax=Staphylococcus coagulans TaxID=74706 RepID=UPI0015FD7F07|nr:SACOL1771 family peroxiredoxin [Staphylococcus coagulans]MBA8777976.1 SACOL1771 family peroxiredoxin [Staphylococcus coagulans]
MAHHQFPVQVRWTGGRDSVGEVTGDYIQHKISIPSELGGVGVGTNPDELLVSAAASCMTISLAATLERAHLSPIAINMQSYGEAQFEQQRFKMVKIVHKPEIIVDHLSKKEQIKKRLSQLIKIADQNCMISNSVRDNVAVITEPTIKILPSKSSSDSKTSV